MDCMRLAHPVIFENGKKKNTFVKKNGNVHCIVLWIFFSWFVGLFGG
jgi:hypothetical protein